MARTALTPVSRTPDGVTLPDDASAANLTDGNSYPWKAGRYLFVSNGDDTALTVTVSTPGTVGPLALAITDATFTVAAGKAVSLPSFEQEVRQSDGSVHVDYSGADSDVKVLVIDP